MYDLAKCYTVSEMLEKYENIMNKSQWLILLKRNNVHVKKGKNSEDAHSKSLQIFRDYFPNIHEKNQMLWYICICNRDLSFMPQYFSVFQQSGLLQFLGGND